MEWEKALRWSLIDGGGDEGQVLSCPRGSGREWKICLAPTDKGVYGVVSRGGLGNVTYGRYNRSTEIGCLAVGHAWCMHRVIGWCVVE